jgi:hypothetical protein
LVNHWWWCIGAYNYVRSGGAFIGGGGSNLIGYGTTPTSFPNDGYRGFIGGGYANHVYSDYSSIVGGEDNEIFQQSEWSFIGGGQVNTMYVADYSSIVGGRNNYIIGDWSFIGGGANNNVRNYSQGVFIGGGFNNDVDGYGGSSVIVGGDSNNITNYNYYSFIGAGRNNTINNSYYSSIVGGQNNTIIGSGNNSEYNAILGGRNNTIPTGSTDTFIIGSNITSISANTTHVERFNIGTVDTGSTSTEVLVRETNGMVNTTPFSTVSGGLNGKYVELITGYTANVTQTITHNLGTGDEVVVDVIDTTNNERIGSVIDNYQTNALDLTLSQNYASIKIVIIG